jgi:hypothetical protein
MTAEPEKKLTKYLKSFYGCFVSAKRNKPISIARKVVCRFVENVSNQN